MGLLDGLFSKIKEAQFKAAEEINERYIDFPIYPGEMIGRPDERNTFKYNRLTTFYKGEPSQEFIDMIIEAGFKKATDVRYDKENLYIIVEVIGSKTKIAYHIKK